MHSSVGLVSNLSEIVTVRTS